MVWAPEKMVAVFEARKTEWAPGWSRGIILGGTRARREYVVAEFNDKMRLFMVLVACLPKTSPVHQREHGGIPLSTLADISLQKRVGMSMFLACGRSDG